MRAHLTSGMIVRHSGQLARILRVWDAGEGLPPKLDIVYLNGTWEGITLQVDPSAIEQVVACATVRSEFSHRVCS